MVLEIEIGIQRFSLDKADEEKDLLSNEILVKLAGKKKSHCVLLENLISFVSQPDIWYGNPEWYCLDKN